MSQCKKHDLHDFLSEIQIEMAHEYNRIQRRASEDPGLAGTQGEETWKRILQGWLPRDYHVVTKGRIIDHLGNVSPEVDVLVLKGSYPPRMLDKKIYLAAGVAAAFECKLTLKAAHIAESIQTCVAVKQLYLDRTGSPYLELHSPIVFGLLANSHSWKAQKSNPEQIIRDNLTQADYNHANHPRYQLDIVCVADLASWTLSKITFIHPQRVSDGDKHVSLSGENGSAKTAYIGLYSNDERQTEHFTPVGAMLSSLSQKMAWENKALRDLADYYRIAQIGGVGSGEQRSWSALIYSNDIRKRVEQGLLINGAPWNPWAVFFL